MARVLGIACMSLLVVCVGVASGQEGMTAQNRLVTDHEYQRVLRQWLGSLEASDLAVQTQLFQAPADATLDELCRLWVLSQHIPPIGGASAPASAFLLGAIEGESAVMRPPADPLALAWLAAWNDPVNPYYDSPALKRRAMVAATVDLIMTDGLHERSPGRDWVAYGLETGRNEGRVAHSDCLGGTLIWLGYAYLHCRDVMPDEARQAYEAGLIKLVNRLNEWGPTRLMTDMDLFASVALGYIAQAVDDPAVQRIAQNYTHMLYTDPRFYDRAGYWMDLQGYDASYNGISFYFANWAALATGRDEIEEALDRAYRLKAHMSLPEPDGSLVGPTHFSPRTSADSAHDQWGWPHRNTAGAIVSDHAAYLVDVPNDDELRELPANLMPQLTAAAESGASAEPKSWSEDHWTRGLNAGFAHYRPGFLERFRRLKDERPEMFQAPFARGETFVRQFDDDFVVARFANYGLVLHTGSVGEPEADWPQRAPWMPRNKPFGFSGGALSAFWTPTGGSIVLGRRGGAQGQVYDRYDQWRLWPIHAVTGQTEQGGVFTSGRILQPQTTIDTSEQHVAVEVNGTIPQQYVAQATAEAREQATDGIAARQVLKGELRYTRRFEATEEGVHVRTSVQSDGQDAIAELCETIPVFIGLRPPESGMGSVRIELRTAGDSDGTWHEAGTDYVANVTAMRVTRHGETVRIMFDAPRRVKLSPRNWTDQYQSRATCRTILIDLRGDATQPAESATIGYRIVPAGAQQ